MKKILCGVAFFLSMQAVASDVFVLSDIAVSSQGETPIEAQTKAVEEGQKQAFQSLLHKIVVDKDFILSVPETVDVLSMVQDVSILEEKMSSNSYKGTISVRFKADPVRSLLKENGVAFLSSLPEPMLLVPVFENDGQVFVFQNENPIYKYWIAEKPVSNLFQIKTVEGDALRLKEAQNAWETGHFDAYKDLLSAYGVSSVLILHVKKTGDLYEVNTSVLPENSALPAHINFKLTDDRLNLDKVVKDLTQDALNEMHKKWVYLATKTVAPTTVYHLVTPVSKVSQLKKIQDKIEQFDFAEKIEIKGFKNKMLSVDISFNGTVEDLAQKLKLNHMILTLQEDSDVYLLTEEIVPVKEDVHSLSMDYNDSGDFLNQDQSFVNETQEVQSDVGML